MTRTADYPTFGEIAQKLVDNGYLPIPIMPETKRGLQGWTTYEFSPKDAKKYSGYSVGLEPDAEAFLFMPWILTSTTQKYRIIW